MSKGHFESRIGATVSDQIVDDPIEDDDDDDIEDTPEETLLPRPKKQALNTSTKPAAAPVSIKDQATATVSQAKIAKQDSAAPRVGKGKGRVVSSSIQTGDFVAASSLPRVSARAGDPRRMT